MVRTLIRDGFKPTRIVGDLEGANKFLKEEGEFGISMADVPHRMENHSAVELPGVKLDPKKLVWAVVGRGKMYIGAGEGHSDVLTALKNDPTLVRAFIGDGERGEKILTADLLPEGVNNAKRYLDVNWDPEKYARMDVEVQHHGGGFTYQSFTDLG